MKFFIPICLFIFAYIVSSCGGDPRDKIGQMLFEIRIIGANIAPADATGNTSPKSVTGTLNDIFWTDDSTGEVVQLLEGGAEELIIINRERILYQTDASTLEETSYSNLTVQFNPTFSAEGKDTNGELVYEANSDDSTYYEVKYADSFIFNKGKGRTFTISVHWYKTRNLDEANGTETFTNPTFETELKEN